MVDNMGVALSNLGNTCYLNALLHVLARVPALRHWLEQHLKMHFQAHAGLSCPLCVVAQDVNHLCTDVDATPFAPAFVKNRHRWSSGAFGNTRQQDAGDAWQRLLGALEEVDARAITALG